ncbi:serine hydrolase domain-containing protein [Microbacterium sp. NPDC055357]
MRAVRKPRRAAGAVAAALVLAVAFSGCSAPEPTVELPTQVEGAFADETQQLLSDAVTHAMGTIGATGAVVGVWAPWSGSWVSGVGTQTPGGAAVTTDMPFRIGQLTRPMTCDLLYSAVDDGLVELDASVSQYVSGVADLKDVTLEQLCDGTSGIGSYAGKLRPVWTKNPQRVWNARELASYGLGQPRSTEPGEKFVSSDANYVLLGLAMERVMGGSARALLQEHVAEPLDLTATRLPAGAAAPVAGGMTGLTLEKDEAGAWMCAEPVDVSTISASIGFTDAGAVSTVDDMRQYVQALATGALLSEQLAESRFADAKPLSDSAPSWLTTAGGAVIAGSLVGNYGSMPGYATAAFADPETGLTVVVALNNSVRGAAPAQELAWELAAIASKAPAASGETAPEAGLPWTPEQYREQLTAKAVCAPPAE